MSHRFGIQRKSKNTFDDDNDNGGDDGDGGDDDVDVHQKERHTSDKANIDNRKICDCISVCCSATTRVIELACAFSMLILI